MFSQCGKKWNIVGKSDKKGAMFRGIVETTIDAKGRTSLPVKFREVLINKHGDERFFLTNSAPVHLGDDQNSSGLLIFPYKEWFVFEENFMAIKGLTAEQRKNILHTIIAPAQECCADKLGRFLIPPAFRRDAALDREIQFVGTLDRIEIWSMSEWDKVHAHHMKNFPSGTEAAAELGL
jgi:MraZ protein